MKKVICSFGTIALIAGSVSDVKASRAFEKASTYGGVVRAPKQLIKSYDAGTGKVVTHDLESGLKWTEKTQEELENQKAMADGNVEVLQARVNGLEKQVIALQKTQQAQQEQLEGYRRGLERIITFFDQVQAFIK